MFYVCRRKNTQKKSERCMIIVQISMKIDIYRAKCLRSSNQKSMDFDKRAYRLRDSFYTKAWDTYTKPLFIYPKPLHIYFKPQHKTYP